MKKIIPLYIIFIILSSYTANLYAQGFSDVSSTAGVQITHDGNAIPSLGFGSGAAWIDFDNDGDLDLYVTMRTQANYLFKNNGDGTFTDIATIMGVADASGDGGGVSVADFNNDGFKDIYLANCGADVLFKNENGASFTDITASSGLDASGTSKGTTASWGDYDDDGNLDLYLANHAPADQNDPNADHKDFLFYNNGDETFTDVSSHLDVDDLLGFGFVGGWTDIDLDGDRDIVLINDCPIYPPDGPPNYTGIRIFRNDGGTNGETDWTFTEVAADIGVDDCSNGMGIAVGDYDRDGDYDFFYSDWGEVNLYKNNGGSFTNETTAAEVGGQDVDYFSWGCGFFDYNLDGWQDLIISQGELENHNPQNPMHNQLFENDGDGTFTDVAASTGMDDTGRDRNCIFGDYDNDGDPDVFQVSYGETCKLKRNDNNNGNNWLQVRLEGVTSNRDGIGSKLKLTDGNAVVQYYETRSGSNLGGGDAINAYFGIGNAASITELEITWPSGNVQTETGITINQVLQVSESGPLPVELTGFSAKLVDEQVLLNWFTASETENDYFTIQRSNDGRGFVNIGKVQGNGTATQNISYNFIDKHPLKGDNYYRIRQTDFDGASAFSAIQLIRFESIKQDISILPNPVSDGAITLQYQGSDKQLIVELFDIMGKLLYKNELQDIDNLIKSKIDVSKFNMGLYFLRVSSKTQQETFKIVIN